MSPELVVVAACAGAIIAGGLLFVVGLILDPARATRRAIKRARRSLA